MCFFKKGSSTNYFWKLNYCFSSFCIACIFIFKCHLSTEWLINFLSWPCFNQNGSRNPRINVMWSWSIYFSVFKPCATGTALQDSKRFSFVKSSPHSNRFEGDRYTFTPGRLRAFNVLMKQWIYKGDTICRTSLTYLTTVYFHQDSPSKQQRFGKCCFKFCFIVSHCWSLKCILPLSKFL